MNLYWISNTEILKVGYLMLWWKQSPHSYQCLILMSVQELKKQQDDYGNSHQIIPFDGRAPKISHLKWDDGNLRLLFLLCVYIPWVQKGQTSKAKMIKGSIRKETRDSEVKKEKIIVLSKMPFEHFRIHPPSCGRI